MTGRAFSCRQDIIDGQQRYQARGHLARLMSVESGTSAQTIAKLLSVLYPDAVTILDATYGSGGFWKGTPWRDVTGLDRDPSKARNVVGDFTRLPFKDEAFDVVVFDPPYLSDVSRHNPGIVGRRFGSYANQDRARWTVMEGAAEAWRVARLGLIVKVQQHVHASLFVDMVSWIRDALPDQPLYGQVEQVRPVKLTDPKWSDQLSVWSNSATFLAFRHGDQRHIRRSRRSRTAEKTPMMGGSDGGRLQAAYSGTGASHKGSVPDSAAPSRGGPRTATDLRDELRIQADRGSV